jgi:hypothetical protein
VVMHQHREGTRLHVYCPACPPVFLSVISFYLFIYLTRTTQTHATKASCDRPKDKMVRIRCEDLSSDLSKRRVLPWTAGHRATTNPRRGPPSACSGCSGCCCAVAVAAAAAAAAAVLIVVEVWVVGASIPVVVLDRDGGVAAVIAAVVTSERGVVSVMRNVPKQPPPEIAHVPRRDHARSAAVFLPLAGHR